MVLWFLFAFLTDQWYWTFFHMLVDNLCYVSYLEKCLFRSFAYLKNWLSFGCWVVKSSLYFLNTKPLLEKAVPPHSITLAWKIPWTEEPGRLLSMEYRRVGHDWATSLSLITFLHWRRKWQPTPVFLPGESQGWGSLVGCCLWGHTEPDTTEVI